MDPYLERRWGDVHNRLCAYISAVLQPCLPPGLRARAEQDIVLEDETPSQREVSRFEGDIAVVETGPAARDASRGSIATVDPIVVRQFPVLERSRWVQIIDVTDGNRVITVIEILSPGNKLSGKLNRRYRQKVDRCQQAGVNIVEIDLLRSSRERLIIATPDVPLERRAAYYTCVNRATDPDAWVIYPMPLRTPFPIVPIPCRETDPDVGLQLQPLIDRIYEEGGHDDIDYNREPPDPPLPAADAEWAAGLIAARKEKSE